ncbi:MAG TPA: vWA domain-containing protein [Bdellovibrionota bacterium]|nr:vWA domain-containing protein [Bdellovibrionota bacterium]
MKTRVPRLRRLSADAIIERARNVLGSVVLPIDQLSCPLTELPPSAEQPEPDLEETLENSPLVSCRNRSPLPQDIWMSYRAHRKQPIILSLDTSLSMTGEKLALTAVALAVVLLQFPDDSIGIIAFENEAAMIKHPEERVAVLELIERFLDIPAQGYTHLEDGMAAALKLLKETRISGQARPASTVLLTDGKYTAGRDPAYLASRFPHLIVLKMGQERASLELCRELARKGSGLLREVGELEALPVVMYGVVKDLLRGRSFS